MSAAGIRAGKAYVELGATDDRLNAGLKKAQQKMQSWGKSLAVIGAGAAGAGAAIMGPLAAATASFLSSGDELSKASNKTGASVEALSELRHAAAQSAVPFKTLTTAIGKQQKALAEAANGNEMAKEKFDKLGLSVEALMKMSPDAQFEAISESISKIENPAQRTAAAMEIFGKSGAELMPLMLDGAKGIELLRQEARDLGLQVSGKDAANATLLGDIWANVTATLKGAAFQIGAALAPALIEIAQVAVSVASTFSKWIADNRQIAVVIGAVGAALAIGGTLLATFGVALAAAGTALGGILSLATAVLSPIAVLTAGIVGLGAAFFYLTDTGQAVIGWFSSEFGKLISVVTQTVSGIFDAIKGGRLDLAAEIAFTGIQLALATVMESVLALFGTNIDSMMKMLAGVIKKVGEVITKINVGRQEAVNWLAEMIGSVVLDDQAQQMLREDNARATAAAQATADDWSSWDSDAAAAGMLDVDKLKEKLGSLNKEAGASAQAVEQARLELATLEAKKFVAPAFEAGKLAEGTGSDGGGKAFGTFSASVAAMNAGAMSIQKRQLGLTEKIERNTRENKALKATA